MPPYPITGRAIGPMFQEGMQRMMNLGIGAEIIYSFVIIVCSLMIYYATKELYELTKHKGIEYFRLSFLFFALAYFFRSFIKLILSYFNIHEIRNIMPVFGHLTLGVFVYFSVMAIFYLVYSVVYKQWNGKYLVYIFHLISITMGIIIVLFERQMNIFLLLNVLLFFFVGYAVYSSHKQSKQVKPIKKSVNLYIIYILLFVFWIFNVLDVLIPNFFQTFQLLIYLISLGIFLTILYKVLRKTG